MANKPILTVPVDTTQFDRFMAKFRDYQEALKAQPNMWGEVGSSVSDAVAAAAMLSDQLSEQITETQRLAEEEKKRDTAIRESEKRRKDEAKEREKRDDEEAKRRKRAIDQVKNFALETANIGMSIAKWTVGGGLLGLIGSGFGLGALASSAGEERRLASGFGISMAQRQGLGLNLQRYFDVNSVLGNVAAMQNDPSSWGKFAMAGINPRSGADPAQMTLQMADAARRMYQRNPILAQQQFQGVFSPEDLRRLGTISNAEWSQAKRDSRTFAANNALSDEVGRKWQNFIAHLDTAGLAVKNKLTDKLVALEPSLEKIITKFGEWATSALDRIDWDALSKGLEKFASYITDGQFLQDMKTFGENIALIAQKIVDGLRWLNLIPADPNTPPTPETFGGDVSGSFKSGVKAGGAVGGIIGAGIGVGKWIVNTVTGNSVSDRNNNPGNLIDPKTGKFAKFASADAGANAMAKQILRDYDVHGQHTLRQLINDRKWGWSNQWAPGNSAQSTANYIASLSRQLGISADANINVHDDTFLRKLMAAMNRVESGHASAIGQSPSIRATSSTPPTVQIRISNQTGTSVATTANAAAGG